MCIRDSSSPRRTTFSSIPGWNPVSAAQRCRYSKLTPISRAEPKADVGEYEIPAGRQLPAALAALEVLRGVRPPQLQVAHEGGRNREGLLVPLEEPAGGRPEPRCVVSVSYTHLRAHETRHDLVCRLLLEKKKKK